MEQTQQTPQTENMQAAVALANSKWEKFAQFMADGKTAKDAYQMAFQCKASTARIQSVKLYARALVRARVDFLKSENARVAALGREESLRILAEIARNAPDPRARIQAIIENNKMNGWAESSFNVRGEGIIFNMGGLLGGNNGGGD